jgi:beta-glucanase (GH16 family)
VTTFFDDFDGKDGDPPNPANWAVNQVEVCKQYKDTGELNSYTNSRKNIFLDGHSQLVIEAIKDGPPDSTCPQRTEGEKPDRISTPFTSARVSTRGLFSQQGGLFEARIMTPTGNGAWPAWWLLGRNDRSWPDQGEIDTHESRGETNQTHMYYHQLGSKFRLIPGNGFDYALDDAAKFHTYAVDVEPKKIMWYVDGNLVHTLNAPAEVSQHFNDKTADRCTPPPADSKPAADGSQCKPWKWVGDQPWYMILNLAVGGYGLGNPYAADKYPKRLVVDWVRASCPYGELSPPFAPAAKADEDQSATDAKTVRCKPKP